MGDANLSSLCAVHNCNDTGNERLGGMLCIPVATGTDSARRVVWVSILTTLEKTL